jgi:hypothetical protein
MCRKLQILHRSKKNKILRRTHRSRGGTVVRYPADDHRFVIG